jgi:hypothetical protein
LGIIRVESGYRPEKFKVKPVLRRQCLATLSSAKLLVFIPNAEL